jgi:hypothetical protein
MPIREIGRRTGLPRKNDPHLSADTRLAFLPFLPRLASDAELVQPAGAAHSHPHTGLSCET